jgi:hypothetical protein
MYRLTPFLESLSQEVNSSTPPIANDVLVVPKDVALVPKVASIYPIGKEAYLYLYILYMYI